MKELEKGKRYLVVHIRLTDNSYSEARQEIECLEVSETSYKIKTMFNEVYWIQKTWDRIVIETLN